MKSGGNVGRISGQIKTDARPAGEDLKVTQDYGACGQKVKDESLLVGPNGELANAVVYIKGIPKAGKTKDSAINQIACVFQPHVLYVADKSKVDITNSDPVLHNAHGNDSTGKTQFNLAMPMQNQTQSKKVQIPRGKDFDTIKIGCDAGHSWMSAHIFVGEHPFGAVTDAKGNFEINGVPAGSYKALVWHEKLGTQEADVTIDAGGKAKIDLKM